MKIRSACPKSTWVRISQASCHEICFSAPSPQPSLSSGGRGMQGRHAMLCSPGGMCWPESMWQSARRAAGKGMRAIRSQFPRWHKIAFCLFSPAGVSLPGWEPLIWGLCSPPPVASGGQHCC